MALLSKNDKIFVAGHRGLVGSAIVDRLKAGGYAKVIVRTRDEMDLSDTQIVDQFFKAEKPDVVFIAAAKVGGIVANNTFRADFIYENLLLQNNLIWSAHKHDVHRVVFLGSSCIYPREAPQPIKEIDLLTGVLEYTNRPYAIAKIAGVELINGLRKQYGRDYFSLMPTNLYGPNDNFHPDHSHVIPGLINRMIEAKISQSKTFAVWGTGRVYREFMNSIDCAATVVGLAEQLTYDDIEDSLIGKLGWSHINVGSGQEVTIRELASLIKDLVGFQGELIFDESKPDGTPRKLLDLGLLQSLQKKKIIPTPLRDGLRDVIKNRLEIAGIN
ncbi:MAG: GDP-L-fucose synthase [Flavobacterium sp.]|nr:MAG: GDP-L-fucose synthase [Flavobacterium sp.]